MVFSWRLIRDRLPTRVALVRRGVMVEDGGCVFHWARREDSQHLFLGCTFSFQIWCEDYLWWGNSLVQH